MLSVPIDRLIDDCGWWDEYYPKKGIHSDEDKLGWVAREFPLEWCLNKLWEQTIKFWSLTSKEKLGTLDEHTDKVLSLAIRIKIWQNTAFLP